MFLRLKCWILYWLQKMKLISRVWYKAELELARKEAKALIDLLFIVVVIIVVQLIL